MINTKLPGKCICQGMSFVHRSVALLHPGLLLLVGGAGGRVIDLCIAAGLVGFQLQDEGLDGVVAELHVGIG